MGDIAGPGLPLLRNDTLSGTNEEALLLLHQIDTNLLPIFSQVAEAVENCEHATGNEEKFAKFRELRATLLRCYMIVDGMDMKIRAEDSLTYNIPSTLSFHNLHQISLEEMSEYFLKILTLQLFLQVASFKEWEGSLSCWHFQLSRLLNLYCVGGRGKISPDETFNSIWISVGPRCKPFGIPLVTVVRIWDHVRSLQDHQLVDEPAVLYEHKEIGLQGFSDKISKVVARAREKHYKEIAADVEVEVTPIVPIGPAVLLPSGYRSTFESDMTVLFELNEVKIRATPISQLTHTYQGYRMPVVDKVPGPPPPPPPAPPNQRSASNANRRPVQPRLQSLYPEYPQVRRSNGVIQNLTRAT